MASGSPAWPRSIAPSPTSWLERQTLMVPAEDPDYEDLGPAFPAWTGPDRDAILQPPKPQIQPSPRILERVTERDLDMEAAE